MDCFAYVVKEKPVKNGRFVKTIKCDALSDLQCEGCKFYKTKEKHEADREKAFERINGLSETYRDAIRETYYQNGRG